MVSDFHMPAVATLTVFCLAWAVTSGQLVFPDEEEEVVEEPCLTPDNRDGLCVPFASCRNALPTHGQWRYHCGFDGQNPKVCCPFRTNVPPPRPPSPRPTPRPPSSSSSPFSIPFQPITPSPIPRISPIVKPAILPENCGMNNATITRIVGGTKTNPGDWPWMTAVYTENNGQWSARCGGALVTNQHVLTASHCVVDRRSNLMPARQFRVRLGEFNIFRNDDNANPIDVNIIQVVMHEQFELRTFKNDIAILKMETPIQFRSDIAPVCLPYDQLRGDNLEGRQAFVTGWGTVDFNGPASDVLLQAQITIVGQEECRRSYQREVSITKVYMCAGTSDGSKDSCRGDSGGPLVLASEDFKYYLVGIVSFGKLCGQPGFPGVYCRVTEFLDWIATNLN